MNFLNIWGALYRAGGLQITEPSVVFTVYRDFELSVRSPE
jgi:hypothetical protein